MLVFRRGAFVLLEKQKIPAVGKAFITSFDPLYSSSALCENQPPPCPRNFLILWPPFKLSILDHGLWEIDALAINKHSHQSNPLSPGWQSYGWLVIECVIEMTLLNITPIPVKVTNDCVVVFTVSIDSVHKYLYFSSMRTWRCFFNIASEITLKYFTMYIAATLLLWRRTIIIDVLFGIILKIELH